ncbi:MAG: Rab family GTPase [Candidatus Odinarchaeia archaeon]
MAKEYVFKVVLVGEPAVGKTTTVLQYVEKIFRTEYLPTIGVDIYNKDIQINDIKVKLMVWDIAGQKGYEMMHKSYYRGAEGAFGVFDLTRKITMKLLDNWLTKVKEYAGEDIPIIILANKADLKTSIVVSDKEIESFASRRKLPWFKTSAKTGENVKEAFQSMVNKILASSGVKV